MAETGTLHDAFIDELHDTYDAEKQLTKAFRSWQRPRRMRNSGRRSKAISRRHTARSNVSNRSSKVWTRRFAASTVTASPGSSTKAP